MSFLSALRAAIEDAELDKQWTPFTQTPTYLIGNGGSASIASHIANDMIKAGHPALVPDYATLTCLANDFGWDRALSVWMSTYKYTDGRLIAISSSGRSKNILNACKLAKEIGWSLVTLTGFDPNNPVRKLGHYNHYVPSHNYGIVECAHLAILHSIVNPGEL